MIFLTSPHYFDCELWMPYYENVNVRYRYNRFIIVRNAFEKGFQQNEVHGVP